MGILTPDELGWLDSIGGWFTFAEGERLAALAAAVPPDQAIVELGSHRGRSTAFAAMGSKKGFSACIYAVDIWADGAMPPFKGDCLEEFECNLDRLGLRHLVQPLRGLTNQVGRGWTQPIGLLHIDASHDFESCASDYRLWAKHVAPGGWLALHDFDRDTWPDVRRVVEAMVRPSGWWVSEQVDDTLYTARRRESVGTTVLISTRVTALESSARKASFPKMLPARRRT